MRAKLIASTIKMLQPAATAYDVRDTVVPGFLLRVQPTGLITYYYSYRDTTGRKTRYRIGTVGAVTPAQARDIAQQLSARVIKGEDVQATRQERREAAQAAKLQTLGGFVEQKYSPWLLAERQEKRRSGEVLQRLWANFATLWERPMAEITPWIIEKWRAEQRKRGKAPSTINRDVTTLRSVLSKAVAWQIIDAHPLKDVRPLRVDNHRCIRYLSEDEESRLRGSLAARDPRIRAARENANVWRRQRGYPELPELGDHTYGDHLTPMVLLSLNTGMRRGELFRLRWVDVNFQTKTLTVRGATAKSGQTRHIPLNTEAMMVLRAWHQQTPETALVFPGKQGEPLDNVRKAWGALVRAAEMHQFRWHDLRHTFASRLVMAGVPLNTVRELLGHTTPSMTLHYAHFAPDHKAEAVNRLCHTPAVRARAV
jgi:integrase